MTGVRRHATSLVVPAREKRKDRRARVRAERELAIELAHADKVASRMRRAAERQHRREQPYLPRVGDPGSAALRTWRPLRVPAHRATSATLATAYPFLAEAGLGGEGMLIGSDAFSRRAFVYDPWVLYGKRVLQDPNLSVAGSIGTGKSALLKSLVARSPCSAAAPTSQAIPRANGPASPKPSAARRSSSDPVCRPGSTRSIPARDLLGFPTGIGTPRSAPTACRC